MLDIYTRTVCHMSVMYLGWTDWHLGQVLNHNELAQNLEINYLRVNLLYFCLLLSKFILYMGEYITDGISQLAQSLVDTT